MPKLFSIGASFSIGLALFVGLAGCSPEAWEPSENNELARLLNGAEVWAGASVWDGETQGYQRNAALVVREGRVVKLFSLDEQPLPEGTDYHDVSGQYIIPGLINAHGHVGVAQGLETGEAAHTEDNVRAQLETYAHYGITSVVSLGDEPEAAFQVRDAQAISNPERARVWLAGEVLDPDSTDAAENAVKAVLDYAPDWLKIRVDDQMGQQTAMLPSVYFEVIQSAHEHELPLAAHMVKLEDAKNLLDAGADLLAHSVRDAEVDDELIGNMLDREICITPTLMREVSTYIYAQRPDFFDDPFFLEAVDDQVLETLQQNEVQARFRGPEADYYREALPVATGNMMRLHEAGVRIAMGTDSGPPARFQGYFEHLEMEMMEEAGMTPEEVLTSATRHAAECMGLVNLGSLQLGNWADFVVLDEDPMESVANLRSISAVYLAGKRFESPYR